jgi:hypothetical protein
MVKGFRRKRREKEKEKILIIMNQTITEGKKMNE